eukprot:1472776-Rhodomonas_salina.1
MSLKTEPGSTNPSSTTPTRGTRVPGYPGTRAPSLSLSGLWMFRTVTVPGAPGRCTLESAGVGIPTSRLLLVLRLIAVVLLASSFTNTTGRSSCQCTEGLELVLGLLPPAAREARHREGGGEGERERGRRKR